MSGSQDFALEFEAFDNEGGSGIRTVTLHYSPDGSDQKFKPIGDFGEGRRTINFCPPNKTNSLPTFKLVAVDNNGNKFEETLGSLSGASFTHSLSTPPVPTVSSSAGNATNASATEILINSCKQTACANDALYYETPDADYFIAVAGSAPGVSDPLWVNCQDVLSDGYTLPPFGSDGDHTYSVWTKIEDTDSDGITPIVSISSGSNTITVNADTTDPALSFLTAAGAMNSHEAFSFSYNLSDPTSGVASAKIFYTPNSGDLTNFPYVELGSISAGSPGAINFCVPHKTHPNGTFKIEATDNAGNATLLTRSGFSINKSANSLLPAVTSMTLATPISNGSSKVRIDACKQTSCPSGSLSYSAPDNQTYIAVSNTQPAVGSTAWVSCADVLANGYDFNFPSQTGSGTYATSLWVKSTNMDLDGSTPVATVSTSSVPLSIPYDYTPPALTGLDLGNIGDNRDLEILGTSILTGYSRGSFRLSPSCIDPSSIPAVQTFITGTVSVSANNLMVTGTGTSFTTEFQAGDYTEIKGIYTQIKSVDSDTQLTLNEISGNNPSLVGSGLQASKRMLSYGGIKVTKGAGSAPLATDSGWQSCDSVSQTITYGNLVNGANNLQFWLKDAGNNVATGFLPFTVNYNAPILSVVGGPTISTEIADISINACGGGTKISHVLFNETGIKPAVGDTNWQSCSTAIGALKSMALSPGNHNLKAYFKYTDNFVSENPVNVPVNYLPQVAWVESPLTNRPQTSYTLASCTGVSEVFINQGTAPLATDSGWQPCVTTAGGVNYLLSTTGTQTVNVWYKSGSTVSSDYSQVTVNYDPPGAYIFGSSVVSSTQPPLTIDSCNGIARVFVKVDEASPVAPSAADFSGVNGKACTTALNGLIPPTVSGEGNHFYDVWFQFTDGYILDRYSRVAITYTAPDVSPPPITAGEGADVPLSLFLVNGDGDGSVPGVTETLESFASRASFTLNTCNPMVPVSLTGTVTVAATSTAVAGSGTLFTAELSAGDFIRIGTQSLKIKSIETDTALTLVLPHTAGASTATAQHVYPEDVLSGMMITQSSTAPASGAAGWLSCSTTAGDLKSVTLPDGTHTLYAWFKDAAGNVSTSSLSKTVIVAATPDTTPPPRPNVIVEGAPNLSVAPAQLTVLDCTDVDQVFVETSSYPSPYVAPNPSLTGWQNCSTATGSITYPVDLAGSYTVSVWFKDTAGNINAVPRDVSFIFDPDISVLPNPVAYWTMDKTHQNKGRIIDAKGDSHLYRWDSTQVTSVTGRDAEGMKFSGIRSHLFTENTTTLKPVTSVTLSLWAYLTNADAGTKGLAGNGSYGIKLEAGNLKFFASGEANSISVPTSSLTTGWHHLIGTSDGRYVRFFIDGVIAGTPIDLGSAANLVYGSSQLFVVGGLPNGSSANPSSTNLFDEKIDEVVVWADFFTDQMAQNHYIDAFNRNKVNEDSTGPATIASATFQGEFMQNALLTIPNCGGSKFIYIDETTHPPLADSPRWQLCNTTVAGIIHADLSQGEHELKIWGKDEYDNISSGYLKVDTTITDVYYQPPGVLYYTLDDLHTSISQVKDIFSGQTALNVGADPSQSAIQNEGYRFVRASSDFVERKYAFNSQPTSKVSMSIWANLTASDNRQQVLAGTRSTGHGYSIEVDQASNELRFIVETTSGTRSLGVLTSSYASGYHNVVGTYDGRWLRLYLDGNEVANNDFTTSANLQYQCLGSFTLGAGASCNQGPVAGTHFDNVIDEVIVWDTDLTASTIYQFFNGQDTVPPVAVPVTPKDNTYTIGIPIAKFNVSDCTDIGSVYVSLDSTPPLPDIANWQACSTTGDKIKSPLLATGANPVKVWFKDLAGNVSLTSTDLTMTYVFDFTIPDPKSYWTLDKVNVDGALALDVVGAKNGVITGALEDAGQSSESRIFDGNDFIEVANDISHQPPSEVTLSLWFKAQSFSGGEQFLAGNYNGGGYGLVLTNSALEFRVMVDGAPEVISTPTAALTPGSWYHVAATYKAGVLRLFLDKTEVLPQVTAASGTPMITFANANSFTMAAAPTATTGVSGSYFTGNLDEVAFWDTALSDTVIAAIHDRGEAGDQVYYDVAPPEIPVSTNITYYNSLVSRANLTINSCAGLDWIIVTKDEFPPDKNDGDWQRCNTLVGGLLSKELSTSESFGKLWIKDNFGNISKTFEYVPITTPYDKPIARPIVHWTFDNAHYIPGTRMAFDRLSQINLLNAQVYNPAPNPTNCVVYQEYDPAASSTLTNQTGVLNQSFKFGIFPQGTVNHVNPTFMRADHPNNAKLKMTGKMSISAWVYLTNNMTTTGDKHIVSNLFNNKGWALRLHAATADDKGLRFTVQTTQGLVEPYIETKNIATGWHLVTGTFDGQTASLFMDGIFVKSFSLPAPGQITYEPGVNTFIAAQASLGNLPHRWETYRDEKVCGAMWASSITGFIDDNSYFQDRIDEIIVWDRALSKLEVSSLYHNGADLLYNSDVTPPPLPTLALENTRSNMYADKAYFSLGSCNLGGPQGDVISGVLVNEGTQPDKQDERWEACRTRLGSFGLENLTPGGHTITTWFKDLAGNVTPASADLVVNYNEQPVPLPNALWPMDSTHTISNYTRDTLDDKIHDLQLVNFRTPLNPGADHAAGVVNEGLNLSSQNANFGAYLSAKSTKLLRPVNFFSIGGWYYLTQSDAGSKVLVDQYDATSATVRSGYRLRIGGGNLIFDTQLDIAGLRSVQVSTASYGTGWHHVIGVFSGTELKLFIDGSQVGTSVSLAERDFVRYDVTKDFRLGASSPANNGNPTSFFGERMDEIGIWGYDLSATQIAGIISTNSSNAHIYPALPSPANVDNAYIFHYGNFGSRTRMTVINCTNTPYIFINAEGTGAPAVDDGDWRNCSTMPGAILSAKLPLSTNYVEVYAKNSDGVVSAIPGRKEILPIVDDYDLPVPLAYFSLNQDQANVQEFDFFANARGTLTGAPTRQAFGDGHALLFNGTTGQYVDTTALPLFDLRGGLTLSVWADLTQGDTGTKRIVGRTLPSNIDDTSIVLEGGYLKFKVNFPQLNNKHRSLETAEAVFPTSAITTGSHFITASFDGYDLRLYLDGILVSMANAADFSYAAATTKVTIDMDGIGGFRLGAGINGKLDEFMVFNRALSETEIVNFYRRHNDIVAPADSTPPAQGRGISLESSTFGGSWTTGSSGPLYTINDCNDIAGVYVSLSPSAPAQNDAGWQSCSTSPGSLKGPSLAAGPQQVYFYYKDTKGNVSSGESVDVNYVVPPRPTPVAYWNLDNDTLVGEKIYEPLNFMHAHAFGILPADYVSVSVGRGIQFDGIRKYVEIEHDPIIKPTDEWSVSFVMNVPASHTLRAGTTILGNRGSTREGFMFRWSCREIFDPVIPNYDGNFTPSLCTDSTTQEYLEFFLTVNGGDILLDVPQTSIGNGVMHMAATFDGRFIRLYKNGVEIRSKDLTSRKQITYNATTNTSLILGAKASDSRLPIGQYFNGRLDEVALFNKVLYPEHVLDIYNNFIQTGSRLYDPGLAVITPPNTRTTIYEPAMPSFGSRLRLTMSDCTDTNMILVSDSLVAPSATDFNWQPCNTYAGGILSAPMTINSVVTPRVWAKSFTGTVSAGAGTANGASFSVGNFVSSIPKPKVHWSLDSTFTGFTSSETIYDALSWTPGKLDTLSPPDSTVIQLSGLISMSGGTAVATGSSTSFMTELSVGDRVRVANQTLQVKTITSNTSVEFEKAHTAGAFNSVAYRIGKINGINSVVEGGYDFNGLSDLISIHPTASSNPYYDISIGAWVELKRGETLYRHIVGNHQDSVNETGAGSGLRIKNGQLQFFITAWTGAAVRNYAVGVDTNIYTSGLHHVLGSYDGRDLKLYIDGVLVKTYSITFFSANEYQVHHDNFSHWSIGAETSTANAPLANSFFEGVIDEVQIWDKALTEQQAYYVFAYGSSFLPKLSSDGIPPTDPGIYLADGLTTLGSPWAKFTMPNCTGANGVEINAVYINLTGDPAPNSDDSGWQYCTTDAGYLISSLLDRGDSSVTVYFRDDQGDISPPSSFNVRYVPPAMLNPQAYYSFDAADRSGTHIYLDRAHTKHIRIRPGWDRTTTGKSGDGFNRASNPGDSSYAPMHAYRGEYDVEKNFSVSLWYKPTTGYDADGDIILNQGQYIIRRTSAETLEVETKETVLGNLRYSTGRLTASAWNHIAVTRDEYTLKIYLNGRLDSSHLIGSSNFLVKNQKLAFALARGHYDEVAFFDHPLSIDQVSYLYFKGEKGEKVDTMRPNLIPASTPNYYFNFDTANFADPYLSSVTGTLNLKKINAVTHGQIASNAKIGESFYFERFEDNKASGESTPIGRKQYLESDSIAPFSLGSNFTLSLWVKQPQPKGFLGTGGDAGQTDQTAVIDLWGADANNKAFTLTYTRGVSSNSSVPTSYKFSTSINNIVRTITSNTNADNFGSETGWVHLAVKRQGRLLTLYVNGLESDSTDVGTTAPIDIPARSRFRIGESGLYSFQNIQGTVSVTAGTTTVTGTGTQFLTDLFETKTGTVDITSGTNTVTGTGTLFTTELTVGNIIRINGESHQIASITNDTTLALVGLHTAGAAGSVVEKRTTNTIRIGLQNFTIASIASDTQLTLNAAHTAGATGEYLGLNINANNVAANDEYAYKGYVDEFGIWPSTALTQTQILNLTSRGNAGTILPTAPLVTVAGTNGSTTVSTDRGSLQINDCNGHTEVWVGFDGDADPLSGASGDGTYPGWVGCTPGIAIDTPILVQDSTNSLRVWFKTGSVVSSYTVPTTITHSSGDFTPPVIPSITLLNSNPTTEGFARFQLGSCSDIAGVFIGVTGSTPASSDAGWVSCTTSTTGLKSQPLQNGVNNISLWFKDSVGNMTASSDYTLTYNEPALSNAALYLTMDNAQMVSGTGFQRELMQNELAKATNQVNLITGSSGMVNESVNLTTNAFYDLEFATVAPTNALTFFAWVKINAPVTDSHIMGRWDGTSANDSYAIRVDTTGRVCLDLQTLASSGAWNTSSYKRACSSGKIQFANWAHIGVMRSGTSVQFYIDNKTAGSVTIDGSNFKSTTLGLRIGAQVRGGQNSPVEGQLDELALWTQTLTADEMDIVYGRGLSNLSLFSEPAPYTPGVSPTQYYKFDSGAPLTDTMGSVNFTTNNGATSATGQVADALNYVSLESDVISTPATALNLAGDFNISLWVKPTSLTNSTLLSKWNNSVPASQQMKLRLLSTGLVAFDYMLNDATTTGTITSVQSISAGSWTHISISRKGSGLYLFLNGYVQQVANITSAPLLDASSVPMSVGGNAHSSAGYYDGLVDDLVIYNGTFLKERMIRFNIDKGAVGDPVIP